ncbi:MAG: dTDP-4-dehydrorhamnose 3,5-epimerase [Betaproteobacteria bacterium]|nr:dTDP-4-dehydrorhamnose 3,5-epimerase [Betaproteobacteria bacterium]
MKFHDTGLPGALIVELEPSQDERGAFTRLWDHDEFQRHGLPAGIDQCSSAYNKARGTLRGMHYQVAPHEESKVVICVAGAMYDVIVDLRPASPTYKRWFAAELSADNSRALYVPAGFAHGYQTLRDHSTVHYLIAGSYAPEHARGVRWNDPAFGIQWPEDTRIISPRDRQYPDFAA